MKLAERYGFEYVSVGELLRKKMIHNATSNRKWSLIAKIITNGELAPQVGEGGAGRRFALSKHSLCHGGHYCSVFARSSQLAVCNLRHAVQWVVRMLVANAKWALFSIKNPKPSPLGPASLEKQ